MVRVPTSYIGRRPQTLVWLVWEAPSDEASRWCEFQRVISAGSLVSEVCLIRQAVWFRQCASSDRQSGFGSVPHQTSCLVSAVCLIRLVVWFRLSVPHQTSCLVSAWFASEQGSGSAETFTFGMVRLRTVSGSAETFTFARARMRVLVCQTRYARMCVLVCQARRFANVCARARARMCVLGFGSVPHQTSCLVSA